MIFDEDSDVQPIRYPDVSMRSLIGTWVGKALIGRQRALVLLNAEVMYAEGMWKAWLKLRARIDRGVAINKEHKEHKEHARASRGTMVSVAPDYRELASWFEAQLREFSETVDAGAGRSRETVMNLRNQFGGRIPEERFRRDAGERSPLHQLIGDFDRSVDVEARYDECIGLFNQLAMKVSCDVVCR